MSSLAATPLVSIILPTYNRAHLLPTAIKTILDQTLSDFELIVVDDGSTDDTAEIMGKIGDPRIRYIRCETNRGANFARNLGIECARASFIGFQDSDDEWLPEKLEKQMRVFQQSPPEVGVVYCGFWKIGGNRRIYIPNESVTHKEGNLHSDLLRSSFIDLPAAIIRKECLEHLGALNANLPRLQDWELFLRISRNYEFRYIAEALFVSYFTPDSITAKPGNLVRALEIILQEHAADFDKCPSARAYQQHRLGNLLCQYGDFARGRSYLLRAALQTPYRIPYLATALTSLLGKRVYASLAKWKRSVSAEQTTMEPWKDARSISTKLSVIVVSYNTRAILHECLSHVHRALQDMTVAIEIIVVDNASSDGSAEMVANEFPNVSLVRNDSNLGFARATNLGTSRSQGEFVLWLNSDAFITSEAITALLAFAQSRPKVGICCPQLLFGNGKWQRSFGRIPSPKAAFLEIIGYGPCMRLLDQIVWQFGLQKNHPRAVEYGDGACLLVRRQMLDEIGLLDERFFFFAEDAEYCLRARKHGWGVYYVPASQVVHLRGVSSAQKAPLRTQQLKKEALHTLISNSYGESAWRTYMRLIRLNYFLRYSICKIMVTLGLVSMNRCANYETILNIYSSD